MASDVLGWPLGALGWRLGVRLWGSVVVRSGSDGLRVGWGMTGPWDSRFGSLRVSGLGP